MVVAKKSRAQMVQRYRPGFVEAFSWGVIGCGSARSAVRAAAERAKHVLSHGSFAERSFGNCFAPFGPYLRLASRPEPLWLNAGCTLTTPNCRSSFSLCAAMAHRKLMRWPGMEIFG